MSWLSFSLLAATSWGIGQIFVKYGFSKTSPFYNNLLATIFSLVLFIPFALSGGINWNQFPQIFIYSFFAAFPLFIYYYALQKGEVSLTGTIMSSYPMVIVILSVIFLKEVITPTRALAILLTITGVVLISKPKKIKLRLESWIVWGLSAAIIMGFGDFIGKVGLTKFDSYSFYFAFSISYIPSLILIYLLDKNHFVPKFNYKLLLPTLIGTFLLELGVLFFYIALSNGPASLVSPISSTYVALTAILAYFCLKEKIDRYKASGIGLVILGIILIGI